jgi:Flp pilus assembly protein protease CpaA
MLWNVLISNLILSYNSFLDTTTGLVNPNTTNFLMGFGFANILLNFNLGLLAIALLFFVVAQKFYEKDLMGGGDIKIIIAIILCLPFGLIQSIGFMLIWGFTASLLGCLLFVWYRVNNKEMKVQNLRFVPILFLTYNTTFLLMVI